MLRRTRDSRGNSKLPRLIDYVLTRLVVSSKMTEKELRVTTRGALNLVGELGMRESRGEDVIGDWAREMSWQVWLAYTGTVQQEHESTLSGIVRSSTKCWTSDVAVPVDPVVIKGVLLWHD